MDIKKIINSLHPLERKVLPVLNKCTYLNDIIKETNLQEVEVMRALQWLQNKDIIKIKEDITEIVELDKLGKEYSKNGLPEINFLKSLKGTMPLNDITNKSKIKKDEINISIGTLKSKAAINLTKKDNKLYVEITGQGKAVLEKESLEENFLKKQFPVEIKNLKDEEKFALENLKKRKEIIKISLSKLKKAELTEFGKKIISSKIDTKDIVDTLTPAMLKTGSWKNKKFRGYDLKINVPKIYGGKRHFVRDAIDYIRKLMVGFGFKEMKGSILQTSFWNFDSLFTAQDHPVRELQDTFYIKDPELGKLPDKSLVNRVKQAHEKGIAGSTGWQSNWSEKEARKNVLRTHTTVLSARTLAAIKKSELPSKFFAIGRCFRNETLDWAHLFEFNQFEGIVIGEDVNFRHHIGFLREFFRRLGFEKSRFRPAYFPYTEMSLEIDVFHPIHKKWIELGGTGIFRPEVVVPLLGKDIPVLAWGIGFDRIIMDYYNIKDMRDLYKNDLKKIREAKSWMR